MTDKSNPKIHIAWVGGNCPVQAEGTINGKEFYFRARGEHWSIGIGGEPVGNAEWEHLAWYGTWPDAGWMSDEEAKEFIYEAACRYHAGENPGKLEDDDVRMKALRAHNIALFGPKTNE